MTGFVLSADKRSIVYSQGGHDSLAADDIYASSSNGSAVTTPEVRNEWINAIFGPDFFPFPVEGPNGSHNVGPYIAPRQGVGLSGFSSYLTYTATIKPQAQSNDSKIGITISRIPLGVYVRMVDVASEAYAAGVVPGSVLLDINEMGVLGEPSHKLLERLWLYEGHFSPQDLDWSDETTSANNNTKSSSIRDSKFGLHKGQTNGVQGPVSMRFIKDGQIYTVVFLSRAPFGISWAPCGNFALVQRAYSYAEAAGIKRGCIVAGINSKNLRTLDHFGVASELKEIFCKGEEIRITCVYTPLSSRVSSGVAETGGKKNNKTSNLTNEITTNDGVRIRKVPEEQLEYGLGTFFSCGVSDVNQSPEPEKRRISKVTEMANRVAAGEVLAPTGWAHPLDLGSASKGYKAFQELATVKPRRMSSSALQRTQSYTPEFPTSEPRIVISRWDVLDALHFCIKTHFSNYREDLFFDSGGLFSTPGLIFTENCPVHSLSSNIALIKATVSDLRADKSTVFCILQIVALLASHEIFENACRRTKAKGSCSDLDELNAAALEETGKISSELIDCLLNAAIADNDVCQTVYFLLRAFLSILAKKTDVSGSIFSPGKFLASAHRQLKNQILELEVKADKGERSDENISDSNMNAIKNSRSDVGLESSISMEDCSTLGTISALSISSQTSTLGAFQHKKKVGNKIASFFRPSSKKIIQDGTVVRNSSADITNVTSDSSNKNLSFPTDDETGNKKSVTQRSPRSRFISKKGPVSILKRGMSFHHNEVIDAIAVANVKEIPPVSTLYENMAWFLSALDKLCESVEKLLLKSFSQKLTDWALQPWSPSKDFALAEGTNHLRKELQMINSGDDDPASKDKNHACFPIMNPMDSSELLLTVIPEGCYILPSAHFPILLSFNAVAPNSNLNDGTNGIESLYRTTLQFVSIRDDRKINGKAVNTAFIIHAAVSGVIQQTEKSALEPYFESTTHRWPRNSILSYNTRSSCGHPRTLALRISSVAYDDGVDRTLTDEQGVRQYSSEIGYAFVDLRPLWSSVRGDKQSTVTLTVPFWSLSDQRDFDQEGYLQDEESLVLQNLSLELNITVATFQEPKQRLLLYKHDDDVRQEMLAIQFIETCDRILKASGLDLKLLIYQSMPVGDRRGFIEWVPGTVSFSEVCKPAGSLAADNNRRQSVSEEGSDQNGNTDQSSAAFIRLGEWCKHESLRGLRQLSSLKRGIGLSGDNPVQEFLRSYSYDKDSPYFIQKDVMDNYIKSCAGYSVITYLLGAGDRHTDNLLLHPSGYFLHCDYSFILGQDPKTYLPMRITREMVNGMGGSDSDNFAKFLSLAGAAFVTLRQHASVRMLMSIIRNLAYSDLPDVSINQTPEDALQSLIRRFRLDLSNDEAVAFVEETIENSIKSRLWLAVDVMHDLGKRF